MKRAFTVAAATLFAGALFASLNDADNASAHKVDLSALGQLVDGPQPPDAALAAPALPQAAPRNIAPPPQEQRAETVPARRYSTVPRAEEIYRPNGRPLFGRPLVINRTDGPAERLAGDCVKIYETLFGGVNVQNECDYPVRVMYCNKPASRGCDFNNFVNNEKIFFPGADGKVSIRWSGGEMHLGVLACRHPYTPRVKSSMDRETRTYTHTFTCMEPKPR